MSYGKFFKISLVLNSYLITGMYEGTKYNRPKIIKECIKGRIKQKTTKGKKAEKEMKLLILQIRTKLFRW